MKEKVEYNKNKSTHLTNTLYFCIFLDAMTRHVKRVESTSWSFVFRVLRTMGKN